MRRISRTGTTEVNSIEMPKASVDARSSPRAIDELLGNYESFLATDHACYPWAKRFVLGYPLPEWQRGFVWALEQQVRFIDSIWRKGDLGSYMVNAWEMSDGKTFDRFSYVLLDGQQRLTSIQNYILNELAVPDLSGTPRYWRELSLREQRRFGGSTFSRCEVTLWDERTLREVYDMRNFSGTPHLESERALPRD